MRIGLATSWVVFCALLAGCAAQSELGSAKFSELAPKQGHGAVHVGRPYGWNVSYIPLSVEIDGRSLAQLGINSYTRIELPPGTYKIAAADTFMTKVTFGIPHPVDVKVEAGKSYFLLPQKWVENVRPEIRIIGKTVVSGQTADNHGTFKVHTQARGAPVPSEFQPLSYVAPDPGSAP